MQYKNFKLETVIFTPFTIQLLFKILFTTSWTYSTPLPRLRLAALLVVEDCGENGHRAPDIPDVVNVLKVVKIHEK